MKRVSSLLKLTTNQRNESFWDFEKIWEGQEMFFDVHVVSLVNFTDNVCELVLSCDFIVSSDMMCLNLNDGSTSFIVCIPLFFQPNSIFISRHLFLFLFVFVCF